MSYPTTGATRKPEKTEKTERARDDEMEVSTSYVSSTSQNVVEANAS